jgi:pimeloyl-ACP methyl ester carboxylesterase
MDSATIRKSTGAADVINVAGHNVLLFLPKGGASAMNPGAAVDVLLFFHGKGANYATQPNALKNSRLAELVASSGRENLVALAPAIGAAASTGWAAVTGGGFLRFAQEALSHLATQRGIAGAWEIGRVSLVGHSAGGVALGQAATDFGDAAQDVSLQDAGYGWSEWLTSWARLRDWLLSPHDFKRAPRVIRIFTKDEGAAAGVSSSTRSVLTRGEGINRATLARRIAELRGDGDLALAHAHAHLERATVRETIYREDATRRSAPVKLESTLQVDTSSGVLGRVCVFTLRAAHDEVRNKTMADLVKGDPSAGEDFAAEGAVSLTPRDPGEAVVIDAKALVREENDLTRPKRDESGAGASIIPKGAKVFVRDYQYGPLRAYDKAKGSPQGYGIFANVDGYGWTLLSNLKDDLR